MKPQHENKNRLNNNKMAKRNAQPLMGKLENCSRSVGCGARTFAHPGWRAHVIFAKLRWNNHWKMTFQRCNHDGNFKWVFVCVPCPPLWPFASVKIAVFLFLFIMGFYWIHIGFKCCIHSLRAFLWYSVWVLFRALGDEWETPNKTHAVSEVQKAKQCQSEVMKCEHTHNKVNRNLKPLFALVLRARAHVRSLCTIVDNGRNSACAACWMPSTSVWFKRLALC